MSLRNLHGVVVAQVVQGVNKGMLDAVRRSELQEAVEIWEDRVALTDALSSDRCVRHG